MAASSSLAVRSSSTPTTTFIEDPRHDFVKQIRSHEVAIGELNSLSSSRMVYQKNGIIFFRTSVQKATTSEQRQVDLTRAKLQKLNSP